MYTFLWRSFHKSDLLKETPQRYVISDETFQEASNNPSPPNEPQLEPTFSEANYARDVQNDDDWWHPASGMSLAAAAALSGKKGWSFRCLSVIASTSFFSCGVPADNISQAHPYYRTSSIYCESHV